MVQTAAIQRFLRSHPLVAVAVAVTLPTDQQVVQVVVAVQQVTVRQAIRQARHHLKATTVATVEAQATSLLVVAVVPGRQVEAELQATRTTVALAVTVQRPRSQAVQLLTPVAVAAAQVRTAATEEPEERAAVERERKHLLLTQPQDQQTLAAAVAAVYSTTLQSVAQQAQADQVWSSFDT